MKNLQTVLSEAAIKFSSFESPVYGEGPEWAWDHFVSPAIENLTQFNLQTAKDYSDYPEGFNDYSTKAKRSLNSAGKKCAKLLEKLLKPKFEGKQDTPIEDIKTEFYKTARSYFEEDAWEWAPMADTDLMENYWDSYRLFIELQYFFGEISEDEYENS